MRDKKIEVDATLREIPAYTLGDPLQEQPPSVLPRVPLWQALP